MRIGSLFAGIGGLESGLEAAIPGAHTVWQVEINDYCRRVLARHWPDADRSVCDVTKAGAENLAPVDLICGGFPCVEISSAGQKGGINEGGSALWWHFARVVRELRPRYVVVENVAALVARGLADVLGCLAVLGYDAEWSVLSSCAVGAPFTRERLFIIASTDEGSEPTVCLDGKVARMPPPSIPVRDRRAAPPGGYRVDDGVPHGMDRSRALGNAVDPAIAAIVGRRVRELMEQR